MAASLWKLVVEVYAEWRARACAQLAAALALYGTLACAAIALVGLYVAVHLRTGGLFDVSQPAGHAGGPADARVLAQLLHGAQSRHDTWIALAVGALIFLYAVVLSALLLQDGLNRVWEIAPKRGERKRGLRQAAEHAPQFLGMLLLSLLLVVLLVAGAGVHALVNRTHRVGVALGILYQFADFAGGVVVLTVVFLVLYAYVAPVRSAWKKVWIASLVSAVLYERGQFGLAIYLGQMNPRSPYADLGVLVAVILWILYSAEIVYAGAVFTKVLGRQGTARKP